VKAATSFGIFPVLICGFAAFYVADTWGGRFETVGYGILCGSAVLILTLILLVRSLRRSDSVYGAVLGWVVARSTVIRAHGPALVMVGSLIAYAGMMTVLGFTVATAIIFVWLLWLMGWRKPPKLILTSAGLTALSHVALIEVLKVPLPEGTLGLAAMVGLGGG